MHTVIILGPPGSGKGTQGSRLRDLLSVPYIATGDIVREFASRAGSGDPLADEIKDRMVRGVPQPDEIINKAMGEKLSALDLSKGIVFDAFPLSVGQAEGLKDIVARFELVSPKLLFIAVSLEEVLKRLGNRAFCRGCNATYILEHVSLEEQCKECGGELYVRDDDKPEVVTARYEEYAKRMDALREYFTAHTDEGAWIEVNGEQSIDEVHREVLNKLGL